MFQHSSNCLVLVAIPITFEGLIYEASSLNLGKASAIALGGLAKWLANEQHSPANCPSTSFGFVGCPDTREMGQRCNFQAHFLGHFRSLQGHMEAANSLCLPGEP
jgi:hypothetical protein